MANIEEVIALANSQVGYLEKASNSQLDDFTANAGDKNYTKYARDLDAIPDFYNGKKNGFPWCDVFIDWLFVHLYGAESAMKLLCQPLKSCGAGTSFSAKYYKNSGRWSSEPHRGGQIFFKNSKGAICHTGLVVDVRDGKVFTVEGNTSSAEGVVANGGCVRAKSYAVDYNRIAGYGMPNYDSEVQQPTPIVESPAPAQPVTQPVVVHKGNQVVREWQNAAIRDGYSFPKYGADGEWGGECEAVARKAIVKKYPVGYRLPNLTRIVQTAVGVTSDGKCGNQTRQAIITYQRNHGLSADGIVGINTWKKILGV